MRLPFKLCSEYISENNTNLKLASDNIIIFRPTLDGILEAINLKTANRLWQTELGGEIISAPLLNDIDEKDLYIITRTKNFPVEESISNNPDSTSPAILRSISKTTGLTNWQVSFGTTEEVFLHNYQNKVILASRSGKILAVSKLDGRTLWSLSLNEPLSAIPFFSRENLIAAFGNKIVVVSLQEASIVFQKEISVPATFILISDNKRLFWGDQRGNVYALDIRSRKKLWKFQNGAEISNIIPTSKGLLLASFDNFVYLISTNRGSRVWKRRLPGRILIEPLTLNDFVLITSAASPEIFILDLSNGKVINQIVLAEENFLLSPPFLAKNLLVFSTLKGIFTFSNSGTECLIEVGSTN